MRKAGGIVSFIVGIFLVVAVSALVYNFLEWEKPRVVISESFDMIGRKKAVSISLKDERSGIRSIEVVMIQNKKTFDVAKIDIPEPGMLEKTVSVELTPRKLKMADGPAAIEVTTVDYSPLRNKTVLTRNVTIDTVPLRLTLLSMAHNVNPGGTCLAVYTLSKAVVRSGVVSGRVFFPGYPETTEKGKTYYVCYFAVPMDVSRATIMKATADDRAGNHAIVSIPFYIRSAHVFRSDKLTVSPDFVTRKAAELQQDNPDLGSLTVEEMFTAINVKMRNENESNISKISLKTSPKRLWQDEFIMMRNGATRARFGDKRTYMMNGMEVGGSLHQGVDVASTQRAPIEASNAGTILFTGSMGIYGNSVIIDHGQGITSLYSHLSSIQVKEGQQVQKAQVIGNSGASGWAGGDHLHVSFLVGGIFVNPIEWWDAHWIKDNVHNKISDAQSAL